MQISMPNQSQIQSAGRHAISYIAGGVTVAAGAVAIGVSIHGIPLDQANTITQAIKDLGAGLTTVAGALATLASVGAAAWAVYSQAHGPKSRSLVDEAPGTKVIGSPELADASPNHPAIMSDTKVFVVPK